MFKQDDIKKIEYDHIEYQIRFNDMNRTQFQHMIKHIQNPNTTISTNYYDVKNNIKKTYLLTEQNEVEHETIHFYCKKTIHTINHPDYPISLLVQQNQPTMETDDLSLTINKDKLNYHYIINDDITLILSETTMDMMTTYHMKIQFKNTDSLTIVNEMIVNLLMMMNNTEVLYTEHERLSMIHDCCHALKIPLSNDLDNVFVKLQHIKLTDINQLTGTYVVSNKAKGTRTLLIFHHTGIWLVKPKQPYHYNLLLKYDDNHLYRYLINSWQLTIFDGDIIKPLNKTDYEFNYRYWYLAHDCLVFNHHDIRHMTYDKRIDYAKTCQKLITWYIEDEFLCFSLKSTRGFIAGDADMVDKIKYIMTIGEVLNYEHTGLVFTPNSQYDNNKTYKLYYPSQITIDFAIYDSGNPNQLKLYVYDQEKMQDVEFVGTQQLPFDESMILHSSLMPYYNNNKMIAECRWDQVLNKMVFVKIRSDKYEPDDIRLVIENWQNINDPIIDC
ncbi:MAG TPA: hypothetical protein VLG50_08060 [Candidatus Saccharimonadales bacterium]|nr:hypothetical protein [Candidatus Saccharimonadales bacterium]